MKPGVSMAAIGVGGALGASVRWGVNELVPATDLPWSTFLVNIVGCALLALVDWSTIRADLRAAAGTGFCGGLTTFSTFAVEAVVLADDGRLGVATTYVVASTLVGLGAYLAVRAWLVKRVRAT
jgi:CrcB protein